MRIVFAPHAYSPSVGGAQSYARGLAEGLAALGHDVHVVVADVLDPEAFYEAGHDRVTLSSEVIGGVEVHRLRYVTVCYRILGAIGLKRAATGCGLARYSRELPAALSALEPDAVLTLPHLFPNVNEVIRLSYWAQWKLVYVPMLHEDDPFWSVERVSDAVQAADGVVALTRHERNRLIESYESKAETTIVVPPGVDLSSSPQTGGTTRQPMVLFLGRRTASKRLDILYGAMKHVWQQNPNARLVIAGFPPAIGEDPAESMSHDPRVEIVDSPSDEEKMELLASANVVANPSTTESFGLTTVEAWAFGKPVVVADSPVSRSIVRDWVDGMVVEAEESPFGQALAHLLANPDVGNDMGVEGKQRVDEEFSWHHSSLKLQDLLVSL